jgi:D-serine deaminase-like pyridoxal phosphate-dependent protein
MGKSGSTHNAWYVIDNVEDVFSPALLVYPDRIEENILRMIYIAGDAGRLRPHIKTHKMPEIVRLQMKHGIKKFKCATIAEAEMAGRCGAPDILLAYQPAGPNINRFFNLKQSYPGTKFSCIADSEEVIRQLSDAAAAKKMEAHIWLDINSGMNRTGVVPGEKAGVLINLINNLPMLKMEGLHVYDGHIHEPDPVLRRKICDESFAPVSDFIKQLENNNFESIKVIAGGSPTFPVHALRKNVELSPGTVLLWDYGYSSAFSDMDFLHAAVLLTRVVSKPAQDLVCLDLGHKSVASEFPQPRIIIPGSGDYSIISHNEEHMVMRTNEAGMMNIGDPLYAIPYHICPTVDRFDIVSVVKNGKVTGQWSVEARKRVITI